MSSNKTYVYMFTLLTVHPPMVNITPLTANGDKGEHITFSCSATGLGASTFVYGWLLNGVPIRSETKQNIIVTASGDTAGDYQCTVRNDYGGFSISRLAKLSLCKVLTRISMFNMIQVYFFKMNRVIQ